MAGHARPWAGERPPRPLTKRCGPRTQVLRRPLEPRPVLGPGPPNQGPRHGRATIEALTAKALAGSVQHPTDTTDWDRVLRLLFLATGRPIEPEHDSTGDRQPFSSSALWHVRTAREAIREDRISPGALPALARHHRGQDGARLICPVGRDGRSPRARTRRRRRCCAGEGRRCSRRPAASTAWCRPPWPTRRASASVSLFGPRCRRQSERTGVNAD